MVQWPWSWAACLRSSNSNCKVSIPGGTTLGSAVCRCFSCSKRCSTWRLFTALRSSQSVRQVSFSDLASQVNLSSPTQEWSAAKLGQKGYARYALAITVNLGSSRSIPLRSVSLLKEKKVPHGVFLTSHWPISKTSSSLSFLSNDPGATP